MTWGVLSHFCKELYTGVDGSRYHSKRGWESFCGRVSIMYLLMCFHLTLYRCWRQMRYTRGDSQMVL